MKAALLLVDLQQDFLQRPGLTPAAAAVVDQAARLLDGCRLRKLPILHVHAQYRADGADRMPHWIRAGRTACVAGSAGAAPPVALAPRDAEAVLTKRYFSAFENPELESRLQALGADTLIVAGLYLHGCVRATVLDGYARGYRVIVVADAVASTEPLHAAVTRDYLEGRAAAFKTAASVLAWFDGGGADRDSAPCRTEAVAVAQATAAARAAWNDWRRTPVAARLDLLRRWRELLARQAAALADSLAEEIGKPVTAAREELQRALAHIDTAIRVAAEPPQCVGGAEVRYRPLGCIALITPWNNPIAIAVGKLAPALAFGNTVVWKPSPHAPRASAEILRTLHAAGLPAGVVTSVTGDAAMACALVREPAIAAVSVTGSQQTGRVLAALCAQSGTPLQAELGGNNAVIVLADADVDRIAPALARAAFGFAGQRCTAIRRFIVAASMAARFEQALAAAALALRVGDPREASTEVGPLISAEQGARVGACVQKALAQGARRIVGGEALPRDPAGRWFAPTLLGDVAPEAAIVQQETFGPVAVIQPAADLDHAIRLANGVPQGLLAGLVGGDPTARARFATEMEAGILQYGAGPLGIHADAPFVGWKASGLGPAEHGRWDREFYARVQVIYGSEQRG